MSIFVQGEVSNLTYHKSGHIYFSLKDADSVVSCVMFKGNTKNLKFRLELGMKVQIRGSLTLYVPRGSYQILCTFIEPFGKGGLALAYEQLKEELQEKGYFETSRKKSLVKFPKNIAIITSNTGAAIEDMKKIANSRYKLCKLKIIPCLVQGQSAKEDIVASLKFANTLEVDFIILARGGGSLEDLWAFNEKCVAQAIYESNKPVISAIGHENDFLISDFVADLRASTPSNAIELALPNSKDLLLYLDVIYDDFDKNAKIILDKKSRELEKYSELFAQNSFLKSFNTSSLEMKNLVEQFRLNFSAILKDKTRNLEELLRYFIMQKDNKKEKKGFVQLLKNNQIIKLEDLAINDEISLESLSYKAQAKILNLEKL